MKVETYEVEEVSGELETMAADSEAIELIEKLGLDGQKSRTNTATATRNPYRLMSTEESFAYSILCPKVVSLKEYSDGPIPLRVLQVAAHAIELGTFKGVFVWCPNTPSDKDPVLVAELPSRKMAILARWGKELDPLADCLARAKVIAKEKIAAKLQSIRSDADGALSGVDSLVETCLEAGLPSYYR